jgi:hypothetical protein
MRVLIGIFGAVSCWVLAAMFFIAWQWPMAIDEGRWLRFALGIMLLEFILVHSGAFLGSFAHWKDEYGYPLQLRSKIGALIVLLCVSMAFVVTLSLHGGSWNLLYVFLSVTIYRLIGLIMDKKDDAGITQKRSAVSVFLFLCSFFVSLGVQIPPAGITPEVLKAVMPEGGGGAWWDHPQQALLAGMLYFGLLGLWEFLVPFKEDIIPISTKLELYNIVYRSEEILMLEPNKMRKNVYIFVYAFASLFWYGALFRKFDFSDLFQVNYLDSSATVASLLFWAGLLTPLIGIVFLVKKIKKNLHWRLYSFDKQQDAFLKDGYEQCKLSEIQFVKIVNNQDIDDNDNEIIESSDKCKLGFSLYLELGDNRDFFIDQSQWNKAGIDEFAEELADFLEVKLLGRVFGY